MKRTIALVSLTIGAAILAGTVRAQRPGGPGGMPGRGFPPPPVMAALDTNGDGEISANEIDNAVRALRTLDRNKDGKLSREEMLGAPRGFGRPGGPDPGELVTRMMTFDKNGDSKLSRDELPERMRGLMERADTNKDGFVDRDELTRLAREQAGRGRGPSSEGERRDPGREGGRGPGQDRDD